MKPDTDLKFISTIVALGFIFLMVFWLSTPKQNTIQQNEHRSPASLTKEANLKDRQIQRTVQKLSPFETRKVHLNFQAMKTNSLTFSQVNQGNSFDQDPWIIPQGERLMAVIDRNCIRRPSLSAQVPDGSFSRSLVTQTYNRSGLETQAYGFTLDRDMSLAELENIAEQDPCLIGLAEDGLVRAGQVKKYSDPSFDQQVHLTNLQASETENFFFDSSLTPDNDVIIAIVDTGVDYKHIDLVDHIYTDSQGRHGFDFANQDNDPMDDNSHGTHVAGLAAAVGGNDIGGVGVMPAKIKIMAVKILDDEGNGSYANVANGIRYAVENGADVINLSLSGPGKNTGVQDALTFANNRGVPVFISAGNNGNELNSTDNFRTPTCFGKDMNGVMTVGSIDSVTSERSSFSNFGPDFVEISSPGSNGILSTLPGNSFGELEGTSMSTPIVAGAAALIIGAFKQKNIAYTAAEIEETLAASAIKNENLINSFKEGRQINIPNIVQFLLFNSLVQSDGGINE